MKLTTKTFALLSLISLAGQAGAVVIAQDLFTYANGDLNGKGSAGAGWDDGWTSTTAITQIQLTDGVVSGGNRNRLVRNLTDTQGADETTVYIGLTQTMNGASYSSLSTGTNGNVNWRFESHNDFDGFRIENVSDSRIAVTPGGEHRYVIQIDFGVANADFATVWQDGVSQGSNAVAQDFSFDKLQLETFGDSLSPTQNLIVATTFAEANAVPEPSSTALLGLGGLALILRRRRSTPYLLLA